MSPSRQTRLLQGPIGSALARLALPMVAGNLLQTGYQLTDAYWVGRLGAAAVAAVAVSLPVMFLVIAAGAGLAIAGATLSAQYMGAGRQDMINHVAAQTMVMVALTSAVFASAGCALAPHLLRAIGVAPDVYDGALGFMRVSFMGIIFVFVYAMFQALMRGIGRMAMPLLILLLTVALNFLLDPLLIFGFGPLPPLGVVGAAMATLITQALAACLGMLVLLRGQHGIQLTWRSLRPDPAYVRSAFLLGLPGTVEVSSRCLGPMALSFIATGFGTPVIAAYGVGTNILVLVTIPAMALSMAVSTFAGQNIGAGNYRRAFKAALLGAAAGFVILTVLGAAAFVFAPSLVALFIPGEPDVIALGARFVRIMCLAWGGIGVQLCTIAALRASGRMFAAMLIAVLSQFVIQLPMAVLLSKSAGLQSDGLWWSFPVAGIAAATISAAWLAQGRCTSALARADANLGIAPVQAPAPV
jgi:putative MATE family efflux protein